MTDINLKTLTPDTSLPTTGFLFGADSQASTNPSVYSTQTVATTLLGSTSLTGDTLTADAPVLNLAQTWNSGAVTFTGVKLNVTDTTSAAASLLMDLQVGGSSKFSLNKVGVLNIPNTGANGSVGYAIAGSVVLTQIGGYVGVKSISGGNNGIVFGGASATTPGNATTLIRTSGTSYGVINDQTAAFGWAATNASDTVDTFLTRKAAANLRFGAADAASPVAQTLSVQSIVGGLSGTPNLSAAAYPFKITGAQGTGTGAGGSIIFQVAPAGGSGFAQNTLVDALTIASDKSATFAGSKLVLNGSTLIDNSGYLYFGASTGASGVMIDQTISGAVNLSSSSSIKFYSGSIGGSPDASFSRAAAGVVQVGTTANNASGTIKAAVIGTTTAYTVATLPTGFQGARAYVTDALAATYNGTLTGGGTGSSAVVPVFYNGTAWVSA